jgi:hypothetical protein
MPGTRALQCFLYLSPKFPNNYAVGRTFGNEISTKFPSHEECHPDSHSGVPVFDEFTARTREVAHQPSPAGHYVRQRLHQL